jgi:hypothetical protein
VLHGLNKKSSTTKLRAFAELKKILQAREEEYFHLFTPAFVNVYR